MAQQRRLVAVCAAGLLAVARTMSTPLPASAGHTFSGVHIRAAGVVPYVNLPGRGVHFLLQSMANGTRAGKLCDFGGRREADDADVFATAARELCEESGGAFGDELDLAQELRSSSTVRVLNRRGGYVCFFHKVSYLNAGMLPEVDASADEAVARNCRWWRADELLGRVPEGQLLERMTTGASPTEGSAEAGSAEGQEAPPQRLSAFHKAVLKTLALENAHPYAHERWHATVLSTIAAAKARAAENARQDEKLHRALASVASPKGLPVSRPAVRAKSGPGAAKAAGGIAGSSVVASKRGSRRGASRTRGSVSATAGAAWQQPGASGTRPSRWQDDEVEAEVEAARGEPRPWRRRAKQAEEAELQLPLPWEGGLEFLP